MIVLSHAIAHHLQCEGWMANINPTGGEQTKESQSSQIGNAGCVQISRTYCAVMIEALLHRENILSHQPRLCSSAPVNQKKAFGMALYSLIEWSLRGALQHDIDRE